MNKNIIQFRKGFIIPQDWPLVDKGNKAHATTIAAEFMRFGFVFDTNLIDTLACCEESYITSLYNDIIPYLRDLTGSKKKHKPFYPGFPKQVMELSECELWYNQIIHYMSNGAFMPDYDNEYKDAFEQPVYKTIKLGTEKEFRSIFTSLVSANQSLTPEDKQIVEWFITNNKEEYLIMPDKVPFKETLTLLASHKLNVPVTTVTDVLRIAVGLSGGDTSLPAVPPKYVKGNAWSNTKNLNSERDAFKFKKFKRAERRYILSLLEKVYPNAEEGVLKRERWIRLGEILHPCEYKNKFPLSFKFFNKLRNENVQSWNGKLEKWLKSDFMLGVKYAANRPGEFSRKLDRFIRTVPKNDVPEILSIFDDVSGKVSNKVLFELYNHFENRKSEYTRQVFIKGKRKPTQLKNLKKLPVTTVNAIQKSITNALCNKFSELENWNKVYLDEELKKIPLPSNMRSLNTSLAPLVRGTRMPITNKTTKVIRAFVHWTDNHGHEDLDLSAYFIGENGKYDLISWNNALSRKYATHSGDVRHVKGSCAEYVDIVVDDALAAGFKYVVLDVRNYTGRGLDTVSDCVCGYMERSYPESSKLFKPSTLSNCFKLQNASATTIMSIIDLETREQIHLDIDSSGIPVASHDFNAINNAINQYTNPPNFSVYDLLKIHVKARKGSLALSKENADVVFDFDMFSKDYVKTCEYMGI
jgi:hypothetical protein